MVFGRLQFAVCNINIVVANNRNNLGSRFRRRNKDYEQSKPLNQTIWIGPGGGNYIRITIRLENAPKNGLVAK